MKTTEIINREKNKNLKKKTLGCSKQHSKWKIILDEHFINN